MRLTPTNRHTDGITNSASSLRPKYGTMRVSTGNLDQQIAEKRQKVQSCGRWDRKRAALLDDFANDLSRRFEQRSQLEDLDEAIACRREALELAPVWNPNHITVMGNLALDMSKRFDRLEDDRDLEESIAFLRRTLELCPPCHQHHSNNLGSLGSALCRRFERLGKLNDINESIQVLRDAVRFTSASHFGYLSNLGYSLFVRFTHLGDDLNNINESISIQQDAIKLTPDGDPDKPMILHHLARALVVRCERLGDVSDINESILMFQHAIRLLPDGHPNKLRYLYHLGETLGQRFDEYNNTEDGRQAIECFSTGAKAMTGPPLQRFHAAASWSKMARLLGDPSLLEAASTALHLLPELVSLGSPIAGRHFQIRKGSKVARRGAAAAIAASNCIMSVEWLEQGRSVIWGQIFQLQTPLDTLKASYPDIGSRLEQLSSQLEAASTTPLLESLPGTAGSDRGARKSLDDVAKHCRTLTEERNKLIEMVRTFPGFEGFLLPKAFPDLVQTAKKAGGPIVMLNTSVDTCDALILAPEHPDGVIHVPLPYSRARHFQKILQVLLTGRIPTIEDLVDRSGDIFFERLEMTLVSVETNRSHQELYEQHFLIFLCTLWEVVVEPVVKVLYLTTDRLSRLWWCPTGMFTFLPLHAAGIHFPNAPLGSKLSDYAISSYTPSVTALLLALDSRPEALHAPEVLVVAQPAAKGQAWLPGTEEEARSIQNQAKDVIPVTTLMRSEATIDKVKAGMRTASHVHFACHGVQRADHPAESALILSDSSRLTLSTILGMRLHSKDLAFLSACQTATGDQALPDEAIHLAAGMLLAGYRGVIATMWQIQDAHAPQVANDVYRVLFRDLESCATKAAEALHFAVKNLRELGAPCSSWVPFIHLGI